MRVAGFLNRRAVAERYIPFLVSLIFGLAATLGTLDGGSFAAIGIVGALLLFVGVVVADRRSIRRDLSFPALAVLTLAACVALNFQSVSPADSWNMTLRLATIFLPLSLFSLIPVDSRVNLRKGPALIVAALLILAVLMVVLPQGLAAKATASSYNRGLSYALLLSWPALAVAISGRRRTPVLLALAWMPALAMTESGAVRLALAAGLAVLFAALMMPKTTKALLALSLFLAPFWSFAARALFEFRPDWVARLPSSWGQRVEIWDFMSFRIAERPWLGWGVGTSARLEPISPHAVNYLYTHGPVSHPHNVFTQLGVELGVVGIALGLGFGFLVLRRIGRLPARLQPFALAAWASAFVLALASYNFWTDSLWAAYALTAFAFAHVAFDGKRMANQG